jgi:Aerotolerance regulator N-terminal
VGITFLEPAVWLAALAVAFPIAIHLLTRATRTPVRFPSIRFLEATRLSASSRQRIQDWPLLLLRIAVIVLAIAALAGPIVVTPAREAAWRARVARAVVLEDRTAAPEDELRSAAVARTFARQRLRDAVADGVRWLEQQAPSTREIVVLSAFRRGPTDAADFAAVPPHVGIRLVRTADGSGTREREISRLLWRDGRAVRVIERLTLTAGATEVREVEATTLDEVPVRVTATPQEQPAADAALRAVLRRGLRLPPAGLLEPVSVTWRGDVEQLADALQAKLAVQLDAWEPETLGDAELAAIARAPAAQGRPTPVDAGDRRLAWALVISLLVAEIWFRKGAAWT